MSAEKFKIVVAQLEKSGISIDSSGCGSGGLIPLPGHVINNFQFHPLVVVPKNLTKWCVPRRKG